MHIPAVFELYNQQRFRPPEPQNFREFWRKKKKNHICPKQQQQPAPSPGFRYRFNFSHSRGCHWKSWAWTQCHIPQRGTATGAVQGFAKKTGKGFVLQLVEAVCHGFNWTTICNAWEGWIDDKNYHYDILQMRPINYSYSTNTGKIVTNGACRRSIKPM